MSRRAPIGCLDEHPNAPEIISMIARLPHIADSELPMLAREWTNTMTVAEARSRALQPDSPLIFEVLATFDAVQALWADDLGGRTELDPVMVSVALKAVRDAIAGAYAKPAIGRNAYTALLKPWRATYPTDDRDEPDLGWRSGDVKGLLTALRWLATRCHDSRAAARWDALAVFALTGSDARAEARNEAWDAALLTGRKRTWGLLRRSGAENLTRPCRSCGGRRPADPDVGAVVTLCLDAACGLLVADAISDEILRLLTEPVDVLIPRPRTSER